jgi:hypothetical protein
LFGRLRGSAGEGGFQKGLCALDFVAVALLKEPSEPVVVRVTKQRFPVMALEEGGKLFLVCSEGCCSAKPPRYKAFVGSDLARNICLRQVPPLRPLKNVVGAVGLFFTMDSGRRVHGE